jgi:AAA domain
LDRPDYFSTDEAFEAAAEKLRAGGRQKPNGAEPPRDDGAPPNDGNGADREAPDDGETEAEPLPKLIPIKRAKGRAREWTVPEWAPKRTATIIQGDGGIGKTSLVQQFQSSCGTGLPWLGLPVEECASLGIYTEDEDLDLDIRQDAIDAVYGCDCVASGKMHMLAMAGKDSELVVFDRAGNPSLTKFYLQVREAALDYRVKLVTLDVLVDLYGGNEIMRRQVRAFMRTLVSLARLIDGSVVATAHVSQAGIQSDGGHSGSTDWSNASRSRAYLSVPKDDGNGPVDPDARVLTRKKANHARIGEMIKLQWRNGVFVPEALATKSPFRRTAEEVFLELLDAVTREGQKVSAKPRAGNNAPAFFMKRPPLDREGFQRGDFDRAMQRLLQRQTIKIVPYGPPSSGYEKLIRANADEEPS